MRWLAIDTSGGSTVGVVETSDDADAVERARVTNPDPRAHVEALAPMIDAVLAEAGWRPREVDLVVVGTGPAPFTGLRVGIATAAAFARAAGCGVHGVCSLDAIAWPFGDQVVVATDARRREVYWAAYDDGLGPADPEWRLQEPSVGPPSDVIDWVTRHRGRVVGPGVAEGTALAGLTRDAAVETDPSAAVTPLALVSVAQTSMRFGASTPLTPMYLRRPDIHVGGARKRAT